MWIQYGEMRDFGETETIADEYEAFTRELDKMTEQDRERYVHKQKQNQQLFTIDQLRDRLTEEGMTEPEIKRITKLRSFEGFSRFSLYSTLIVLLGLMGAVVYFSMMGR